MKQSQELSGFLLYIMLLNTQYLKEPWAPQDCCFPKESKDTFSDMVEKCSVQIQTPGKCQIQDHS